MIFFFLLPTTKKNIFLLYSNFVIFYSLLLDKELIIDLGMGCKLRFFFFNEKCFADFIKIFTDRHRET